MTAPELCRWCGHPLHTHSRLNDRVCSTVRVTGPAVDSKESISKQHYEHIGRDVEPCPCRGYESDRNGATR